MSTIVLFIIAIVFFIIINKIFRIFYFGFKGFFTVFIICLLLAAPITFWLFGGDKHSSISEKKALQVTQSFMKNALKFNNNINTNLNKLDSTAYFELLEKEGLTKWLIKSNFDDGTRDTETYFNDVFRRIMVTMYGYDHKDFDYQFDENNHYVYVYIKEDSVAKGAYLYNDPSEAVYYFYFTKSFFGKTKIGSVQGLIPESWEFLYSKYYQPSDLNQVILEYEQNTQQFHNKEETIQENTDEHADVNEIDNFTELDEVVGIEPEFSEDYVYSPTYGEPVSLSDFIKWMPSNEPLVFPRVLNGDEIIVTIERDTPIGNLLTVYSSTLNEYWMIDVPDTDFMNSPFDENFELKPDFNFYVTYHRLDPQSDTPHLVIAASDEMLETYVWIYEYDPTYFDYSVNPFVLIWNGEGQSNVILDGNSVTLPYGSQGLAETFVYTPSEY